ncbi:MAG: hypothetical protein MI974_27005 [Chitinophagales bacterium]|nr:hypothetical protein [Chitinophagales bacterium]
MTTPAQPQSYTGENINLSYFRIRKWIGTFGVLLPIMAPIISGESLPSISHYYYTVSNILFTSLLILIGVFLASYHGYDKLDNIITWVGGICIIIVAIVPTPLNECCLGTAPTPICCCESYKVSGLLPIGYIHFGSAVLFFICMAFMSIRQFTKGDTTDKHKKMRNRVYYFCGYGILATIIFAGVMIFAFEADKNTRFIFWVEVVMLVLFAIAWLIKGRALRDVNDYIHKYM